jgi:hypothetical protein
VNLGLPDLTLDAMAKLAAIADLQKRGMAWQTEPRLPAGQPGGGQWTTGGAASTASVRPDRPEGSRDVPSTLGPSAQDAREAATEASVVSAMNGIGESAQGLLIPVNNATTADGYALASGVELPAGLARLGRVGLLAFGASLLDQFDAGAARRQITSAISRFGLDSSRPADVVAASAYLWSRTCRYSRRRPSRGLNSMRRRGR